MKKILLSLFGIALLGTAKIQAQCTVSLNSLVIEIVGTPVVLSPNKCEVTFNAQFDIAVNSGFKVLYFHSWLANDYPATPIFDCTTSNAQDPGTATQLGTVVDAIGKSFLDIGFTDVPVTGPINVVQPLTFSTSYAHDPTVVLTNLANSPGITASKFFNGTVDHYTVNNIKVIVNTSCSNPITVFTDVWGSNANAPDPKAQCYICGLSQSFNDPLIAGSKLCTNPRGYTVSINTSDPVLRNITYKVYLDANGNNILETAGPDILAYTSPVIQISAPGGIAPDGYAPGVQYLAPAYSATQPNSEYKYFILVEGPTLSNSVSKLLSGPTCSPGLPVTFNSFSALRNHSNVLLKWETSLEQNSSGFAVERNTNGTWQEITFVPSQATGGNSNDMLSYQYMDANNTKGISQYRIRQVDFDSKSKYTEIRTVRGEAQIGKIIVYPNPTLDGKVNVSFEDASLVRDVSIMDMSGRVINQWKAVTNNNIKIENLTPGMYTLRVVVPETGEQTVMKIVVNKR